MLNTSLQRLENDCDVLSMWKIGLVDTEKEVHVYLDHAKLEGGLVNEIGPEIEVGVLPLDCSA